MVVFDKLFISALALSFFFFFLLFSFLFALFISPIFLHLCCFTLLFFHVVWPYASLVIPLTWVAKFLTLVFVARWTLFFQQVLSMSSLRSLDFAKLEQPWLFFFFFNVILFLYFKIVFLIIFFSLLQINNCFSVFWSFWRVDVNFF